uniref:8-amino-7-oxononanoate synthase n=2 Tax=Magnetospirillum gryphiswaldense TaxID=55518 RepID=A4TXR3_9PROT|nr:8-amino-7-oxononanoate synthase [Magnetospirillum gryphiswaldense MSR-1]
MGGFGAYVAGSQALKDFLVNRASGLIYATALPPAVLGAMDAAIDLVPTLTSHRARLQAMAQRLRLRLNDAGLDTGHSTTQIVPVILGDEDRTLKVAARLEELGFLGIAIRPPTVPPGSSRIRFALSAGHAEEDVERLADAIIIAAGTIA